MRHMLRVAVLLPLTLVLHAQDANFPIPSGMSVDGVPPIPRALADAVRPYGQFRMARLLGWHPTEPRLLINTSTTNVPQIHEVRNAGGSPMALTSFPDGVSVNSGAPSDVSLNSGASYDPTGKFFVFRKDTSGGGEAMQLFRYDSASVQPTLLTDGKSRNGVPAWSHTRGLIAYDSTRRNGKDRDLYVMDPTDPKSNRLLLEVDGTWSALDWSPDDTEILAHQKIAGSTETRIWRVAIDSGKKTLVTPSDGPPSDWSAAQYAPGGKAIYALSDRDSDNPRVWKCNRANGTWSPVTDASLAIEMFAVSPIDHTLAVVVDRGATSELRLIDGASGKTLATPDLPPGVIWTLAWQRSGARVGVEFAGARTFRDVYAIDVTSHRAERWTTSEIGGANAKALPEAELIDWKSFDGRMIHGILYRPAARFTGPRPVLINIHGGPETRERPRMLGRSNYFRNENGIAIIYPNVRGSTGYGKAYEHLDDGRQREDAVKDIGALLDWIATQPDLDKTRVLMTGVSYGGYIALSSAIKYGDRIRCVMEGFGLADIAAFLDGTDPSRRRDRLAEYGDPADPDTRAFLKSISPLTHAGQLKLPLLMAHGRKDTRIPLDQADAMVKAVRANGTPVWYLLYDGGHEELTNLTNDYTIYTWALFIQTYLLN
jgi:dipeptidyl aminopeptidase/acylaminoacyl peptidase